MTVNGGKKDITKIHKELLRTYRPKVLETEGLREEFVDENQTQEGLDAKYDAAKDKVMKKYGIGYGHQGKSLGDLSKAKYKQFFKDMDKGMAKI